jgi:hypothetical protein
MTWWHFEGEAQLDSESVKEYLFQRYPEGLQKIHISAPIKGRRGKFLQDYFFAHKDLVITIELDSTSKKVDEIESSMEAILAAGGLFGDGGSETNFYRYKEAYDPFRQNGPNRGPIELQWSMDQLQAGRKKHLADEATNELAKLPLTEMIDSKGQVIA